MDQVVLVDEQDRAVGTMEKMEAHRRGKLHRAFSILVYNSRGELLVHQRSASKYHSAGLWTNTCCSHPRPEENIRDAAARRLKEEMGIDANPEFLYSFIYQAAFDNGLIEHELDHVFRATFDGIPQANPKEVQAWRYVAIEDLQKEVAAAPDQFTHWFKLILQRQDTAAFK